MELDLLDRKILAQLDMNSRQSAQEIAKKVKNNKDTVNYRIRRLVDNGVIIKWIARIQSAKFGYNATKVYIRFQDTDEKKEKEFFDYLNSLPEVAWVAQASGRWDALFAVWSGSNFSFYNTISKIMNRFSRNIYEKEIIHNIIWFYYNRKWLLPESNKIQTVKYGGEPLAEKLDETDIAILRELANDSRANFTMIADLVKTSPQNVLNRVKSMRSRGIIPQYGIELDYEKLGLIFTKSFIQIHNADEESLSALYRFCEREPKVFALSVTLGSWDVEIEMEVNRMEEMLDIMNRIKRSFPDMVKGYDSIVITKQLKINDLPYVQ